MRKDTPSMAKNKIRRSLYAILDPHPKKSEEDELWEYFNAECVYCGKSIERSSRKGHLDHVLPSSAGGTNSVFNHVLSCSVCNGDEKREADWLEFLRRKTSDSSLFNVRKKKIEDWLARSPSSTTASQQYRLAEGVINDAISAYEDAVTRIRAIRDEVT